MLLPLPRILYATSICGKTWISLGPSFLQTGCGKPYFTLTLYTFMTEIRERNRLEIGRIQNILDAFRNGLISNKEKFEKYVEGYESDQTNKTNKIIAVIGVDSAHWSTRCYPCRYIQNHSVLYSRVCPSWWINCIFP
jgi:hypothetical protein